MCIIKSTLSVFYIFIFLISCSDSPQKSPDKDTLESAEATEKPKDTPKQINLLDEQAKMLSKVFGNVPTEEGRALKNVTSYRELVEQANFPPDIKKNILDQYKLYELSLDPRKKDSLKLIFNKQLNEAMAKSLSNKN